MRNLHKELVDENIKIEMYSHNLGAIDLAKNEGFWAESKHIGVEHHFIKAIVAEKRVALDHISTDEMVGDILTKALPEPKHAKF